ncbi:MAG: glycosyltransferase family 39 protein, partial [Cyanobacteria bacterium]|nr:glycosyltransferase family 39 protein [Cyanobacteriota bacterium]
MFNLAILVGIYSYLILDLAFLDILYKKNIYLLTAVYLLLMVFVYKKSIKKFFSKKQNNLKFFNIVTKDKLLILLSLLFLSQAAVNLIGALGPELSFDALWYHLTFPKLYLLNHSIVHTNGGNFYYSYMPKLIEMIYTSALAIHSEILAKIIHFFFGILSAIAIYLLSRKFFSAKISLIASVIFYSNLVIVWESIAAYRDLGRTFFEILALWSFIEWAEKQKIRYFLQSAIMIGLAITTQVLAFGSLFIFLILTFFYLYINKNPLKKIINYFLIYFSVSLFVPLPCFV